MSSVMPALIMVVLIILNALFVAAEFAIIGASRTSIERLASQGDAAARLVRRIQNDPRRQDRYLATSQIGITLASLGLGMYGEHVLAEWMGHHLEALGESRWIAAHTLASVLAVTILTYFHIVLGEMIPKTLALQSAERTVLFVTRPMIWIQTALYPLVVVLNALGNGILKLMGVNRQMATGYYHTPEELEYVIEESKNGGLIRSEAGDVMHELFRFGELTAGEVMVPRVHITGIQLGAAPDAIRETIRKSRHTRYPVYSDDLDHIEGSIHIKDLLRLLLAGKPLDKDELRSVPYVPDVSRLDSVLEIMRRAHTQMVIAMDEFGGTAGLVTMNDLFEEVVGEMEDTPTKHIAIREDSAGRFRVLGTMRLDEVGELLSIPLEHPEVESVSGLMLALLDRIPIGGDIVTYDGVTFEVHTVDGHGVGECIVTLTLPSKTK